VKVSLFERGIPDAFHDPLVGVFHRVAMEHGDISSDQRDRSNPTKLGKCGD
jgi:hypothetical protein